MLRAKLVIAGLLLIPSVATAQRSRGGGSMGGSGDANWNEVASKSGPGGPSISGKDFEGNTPYKFVIDKKKDIKLTDAQITALKTSDASLKESSKAKFAAIDSLRKEARPQTSGTPSAENEAKMVIAREALQAAARDLQASFDEAAKGVLPMLEEVQRPEAQKALDKYNEEMRDMLREKVGGGRGGPGGGGRGRGRGGI